MERFTLSELRSILEKREEYVTILSDYELLHSTFHDLGLDDPAIFCNIAQKFKIYGRSLPISKVIFSYKETNLTVEKFLEKLNGPI